MKKPGQVVLTRFPKTNLGPGKIRPAILIARSPSVYDDWLTCMITSKIGQYIESFDELIDEASSDFDASGLRIGCVVRVARVAVISESALLGALGEIEPQRLTRIKQTLARWIQAAS